MNGKEFKDMLREFNLSYAQAGAILGISAAGVGNGVSRGAGLIEWANKIRLAVGECTQAVHKAEDVVHKTADRTQDSVHTVHKTDVHTQAVYDGPTRNESGVLVAQLPGLTVSEKSAERGHPEWDIMSDGFARGYRFVRNGVPEDDDLLIRKRYRSPAAFRRQGEKIGLEEADIRAHIEKRMQAVEPGWRAMPCGKKV